jgi:GNAT superfamily N-acetyltransferase
VRIRPAHPEDTPAVAALVERAFTMYIARIGRRPAPMDADHAAQVAAGHVFLAEDPATGRPLGCIVLMAEPDHLLVDTVAVDPDAQGHGLGRGLLAFAEDRARGLLLAEIRLYTHALMTENRSMYAHLGYEETDEYVGEGFRRVGFRKRPAGP